MFSLRVMTEDKNFDMIKFIEKLHKKNRALVSDEYVESLDFINSIIPLKYHKYKTGEKVWTWKIPKKWVFKNAHVIDGETGNKIVDTKDNLLHVHINSSPVDKQVSKEELMKHLCYREDLPDAVPYCCKYYREDWGFSVRYDDLDKFKSDKYLIKIDSKLIDGEMVIGEHTVKGTSNETIIIPIHLDHPWQCNDNLSGCAVAIKLIFKLQKTPNLRYNYKFLFIPETIGSVAYLAKNENLLSSLKYGIVFDSVGNKAPLKLTTTKDSVNMLNDYAKYALREVDEKYETLDFFDDEHLISANDERILQSTNIDIPSIALSRSPFEEYHTDKDSLDIIDEKMLNQTIDVVYNLMSIIDRDFKPKQKYKGTLCLSECDLWDAKWTAKDGVVIQKILQMLDGKLSVFEISEKINKPFDFVYDFVSKLKEKELVKEN